MRQVHRFLSAAAELVPSGAGLPIVLNTHPVLRLKELATIRRELSPPLLTLGFSARELAVRVSQPLLLVGPCNASTFSARGLIAFRCWWQRPR